MAKLVVVIVVYFLASALTSYSDASRSLSTPTALSSTDKSFSTAVTYKLSVFSSASAPPATESGIVSAVPEEVQTESESGESVDVAGPLCTEDLEDSSVDGERPCNRKLEDETSFSMKDYGGLGHPSPNPKHP